MQSNTHNLSDLHSSKGLASGGSSESVAGMNEKIINFENEPLQTLNKRSSKIDDVLAKRGSVFAAISGTMTGILVSMIIHLSAADTSSLGRMFDIKSAETIIPVLILILFFWGLFLCILRSISYNILEQSCSVKMLSKIKARLQSVGVESAYEEMDNIQTEPSPLFRRIKSVLKQWLIDADLQSVDFVLQEHVAHDEAAFHRDYSVVRLFVWALPVLGLIGTVIGISIAVGGFASFLGGSIDEVAEIKKNLVSVTGGLSFAFLITLEGLATSLVLMFISSSLQNKENRLMSIVQKMIVNEIIPILQQIDESQTNSKVNRADDAMESAFRQALKDTATGVFDSLSEISTRMLQAISTKVQSEQTGLDEWLMRCSKHFEESATKLSGIADRTNNLISNSLSTLVSGTSDLKNLISEKLAGFDISMKNHEITISNIQNQVVQIVNRQTTQIENNIDSIKQIASVSESLLNAHASTVVALNKLNESKLTEGLMKYSDVMERQILQTLELKNIFAELSKLTDDLIKSHKTLKEATVQFHQSGFSQTLSSAVESLNLVVPVLKEFSKPFVIKAVPIDPK